MALFMAPSEVRGQGASFPSSSIKKALQPLGTLALSSHRPGVGDPVGADMEGVGVGSPSCQGQVHVSGWSLLCATTGLGWLLQQRWFRAGLGRVCAPL
jgi:hypothetical protein